MVYWMPNIVTTCCLHRWAELNYKHNKNEKRKITPFHITVDISQDRTVKISHIFKHGECNKLNNYKYHNL